MPVDQPPQTGSLTASSPAPATGTSTSRTMSFIPPPAMPYEAPDPSGTCHVLRLPEEVLVKVFTQCDRRGLTRCFRVCKSLNELLNTNTSIQLHHLLLTSSLTLNPNTLIPPPHAAHVVPPTPVYLLNTLRERITRFRTLAPKSREYVELQEREGNLYEYLEGVLMRGISPGRGLLGSDVAFYDLGVLDDWEDIPAAAAAESSTSSSNQIGESEEVIEVDEELNSHGVGGGGGSGGEGSVRRVKDFGFEVAEFAVDPGQDLLVLVQVKTNGHRDYTMIFHLFSLSTFTPHPLASHPILEWPSSLLRKKISLSFQICDDGLFVLLNNERGRTDQLCGWQWTTGRLGVTLRAFPTMSFESFVLLTPSSFVIPTIITHLDLDSDLLEDIEDGTDLSWTHHLHLYAFPPFSSIIVKPSEPVPPPHTAIKVTALDLPRFHVDLARHIPPPRLGIRTDPPPRHQYAKYPLHGPSPFHPDPESGLIVMDIHCQVPGELPVPHYQIMMLKKTLINYLPAPTSPLLYQAFPRPAPVVSWSTLAPFVRILGPDIEPQSWVCYLYQNRYITPYINPELETMIRLYDFDPLRVRKELNDRKLRRADKNPIPISSAASEISNDGLGADGVELITAESVSDLRPPFTQVERTGRELPYVVVEESLESFIDVQWSGVSAILIDGERIVLVSNERTDLTTRRRKAGLQVLQF